MNTDTDSDAELDYKPRKYALRTWKCHSAPADLPPTGIGSESDNGHDTK